jgi:hypothetical protein
MENEIKDVNDIVTKAAETNSKNSNNGNEDLSQQQQQKSAEGDNPDRDKGEQKNDPNNPDGKNPDNADDKEKKADDLKEDPLKALFEKYGVKDEAELAEKLKAPEKEPTPEEKEKADALYKADIQRFAVEKGEMKLEDFTKLENLKNKADKDLVFDNWLEVWKEENEDNEDLEYLDQDERLAKAKADFDKEYKLDSKNEKVKARGESKLAKEAKEIRQPLESSYNKVKESFDTELNIRKAYPEFDKTVKSFVKESIPDKYDFYKGKDEDEEIPIEIELSKENKVEIETIVSKIISNPDNFYKFNKDGKEALKSIVKTETDRFIAEKYREEGLSKMAEKFLQRGAAKAKQGATNSFAIKQDKTIQSDKKTATDAKTEVLNSLKGIQ